MTKLRNPYNIFRVNNKSSDYSDPSYLAFDINFIVDPNILKYKNSTGVIYDTSYDQMPNPLFMKNNDTLSYSTLDYLFNHREDYRYTLLQDLINRIEKLNNDKKWMVRKIDGLGKIYGKESFSGNNVNIDLKVDCYENTLYDIFYILNLYKNIAYDSEYQRWILPEMMRYFTMVINVYDFRKIHQYSSETNRLEIIKNITPVFMFECEMCEFDITSINLNNFSSINVNETPTENGTSFSIHAGRVYEKQYYINQNTVISSTLINDSKFKGDSTITVGEPTEKYTIKKSQNGQIEESQSEFSSIISQAKNVDPVDDQYSDHMFGETYWISDANKDSKLSPKTNTVPTSWVGKVVDTAVNKAINYGVNYAEDQIKQGLMNNIPGLGTSVSDIISSVKSGDIVTMYNTYKSGKNGIDIQNTKPSEQLDGGITYGRSRNDIEKPSSRLDYEEQNKEKIDIEKPSSRLITYKKIL